ncbi:MAG TPA: phenylacetate--CoA ligase, partial [Candidatus Hydrogenedentes bacterium]|nr:phenylacetate--CoA ligase [Candidatus Hydrogenedentota bacterium]
EAFSDKVSVMEGLRKKLSASIERVVNIRVNVRLVEPNKIARSEGKAKRLIDNRKK